MPNTALVRALLATVFLVSFGCGYAAAETVPLPRPRPPVWLEPMSFREAAGPDFNSAEVTASPTACDERLAGLAAIAPMPRLIGPGACGGRDMVQLDAVLLADRTRIAVTPAPVLRCEMAESLASWIRDEAAPRIAATGAVLRSVDNYDDFECRGRNRVFGAKISEHGMGNAIDVRSFTLCRWPRNRLDRHDRRPRTYARACARAPASASPRCSGPAPTASTKATSISISPSAAMAIAFASGTCASRRRRPRSPARNAGRVPLPTPRPAIAAAR